ncbi:MAG: CBO0543 family protein [Syntrophomonadaceae bacterium]
MNQSSLDYWLANVVGRWYWWFLVFWTIFPFLIWWKYTDRSRFLEISFFGVIVGIWAGILDTIGFNLGAWTYPYPSLPFMKNFFPIDYVVIPVVFMLVYQKYSQWKQFVLVSTIVASFLSLILDPIMAAVNIYQPLTWQYYYSVPVFVLLVSTLILSKMAHIFV